MFPIERLDDFGREDRLELLGVRALVPQIAEHIPASAHHKLAPDFVLLNFCFTEAVVIGGDRGFEGC